VPSFIEWARAEAARERLTAEFVCGDLRAFASPPEFDAAISLFDAFGFHADAGHALCARARIPGVAGLRRLGLLPDFLDS
jgi:hypothetical protein